MAALDKPETERTAQRRRVLKAGVIAYNERHVTLPCGIRDLSQSGARLLVSGSISAPDTFELIVDLDGTEAPCEVIWRRGMEIGVRFLAPMRAAGKRREQVVDQWAAGKSVKPTLRRKPLPDRS